MFNKYIFQEPTNGNNEKFHSEIRQRKCYYKEYEIKREIRSFNIN